MKSYKIYIHDNNYQKYDFFDTSLFEKIVLEIDPIEHKLFTNDTFIIDNNSNNSNNVQILHSSIRSSTSIPGVLVLNGNKTYGREKKSSNKSNKLLYKCIPDDKRLPSFLIPYEIKNIGFSKVLKNIYVTFCFDEWNDKHPKGKLENVIGSIDILDHFYEYQLYCKSLNASIQKFKKDTIKALETKSQLDIFEIIKAKYPEIKDRTVDYKYWHIFTIDPVNSLDFDDGFSIIDLENGMQQISIYISNVTIWMDVLNLWGSFSQRISTIYLPDKKRPMLPTVLSEGLCSLQENVTRIAFVMDLFIDSNKEIIDIKYSNCFIKVFKNYCYENHKLFADSKYHKLFETVQILSKKYKYVNNIKDSHDVVGYLMILMNFNCAKELIHNKTGIFRSTVIKKEMTIPKNVPEDVGKFITIWNGVSGQYINGSEIVDTKHEILDMDAYIHITSPIRRLVDLLNIIKFQQIKNMILLSDESKHFYNNWLQQIEYINTTMRSIRKVQCDCTLLDLCMNEPSIMEKKYDGYVFDKIIRNDGLYQYVVFLPCLKLSSRIITPENFHNFECKNFKLFLFHNEDKFKRKIRLHLLE